MNAPATHRPTRAELDAAQPLLARMGISPADLLTAAVAKPPAPTFAEYVPVVSRPRSAPERPSDIEQLAEHMKTDVVVRRNARGGRGAAEHVIAALRCLYSHAIADGLITEADNPACKVAKPRRLASTRRAVPDSGLAEINHVAASSGNDPALDSLLLRLHTETACRRGGALALRPADLDAQQYLVLLREKGGTVRWQPISPTLVAALQAHAEDRQVPPMCQLLRYRNFRPITYRRYDHLWSRIGEHLPWVSRYRGPARRTAGSPPRSCSY